MSYWRQRKQVELWKKVAGKPYVEIPDELVSLEAEQLKAKALVESLKARRASEAEIGEATVKLGSIEYRMKQIIASKGIK